MILISLVFLALLACGVTVVSALLVATLVGLLVVVDAPLVVVPQTIAGRIGSSSLMAIPLFLLMANLLIESKIGERLFDLARSLVGHIRGGLGQVAIATNTVMAGFSGSSLADAALSSRFMVPEMMKAGWDRSRATALVSASALIAPVIPPSVGMIVYASITGVSVGALFLGGILPGFFIALGFMGIAAAIAHRGRLDTVRRATVREVLDALRSSVVALGLPVLILLGLRFGIVTATEGGALGVTYVLLAGLLYYRTLDRKNIYRALKATTRQVGALMLLIGLSAPISWIISIEGLPQQLSRATESFASPNSFFLAAIGLLVVLGLFLETTTILVLISALLAPLAITAGVHPVVFGVAFVIAVNIGSVTPPFGQVVFVTSTITGARAESVFYRALPYVCWLLMVTILLVFVPQLVLLLIG